MRDDWIEVGEAAALLGVQPGRVRQLLSAGDLAGDQRSGRWWVRLDGVQRMAAVKREGRPFSPRTAWAVLAGVTPDLLAPLLDRRQAWRVDRYVADLGRAAWRSLQPDVPVSIEGRPNLFVRVVDDEVWPFPDGALLAPGTVGAVDLLEHADGRSRRAGRAALKWGLGASGSGR